MKLILEYYNNAGRLPVVGERLTLSGLELEVINISIKSEFNSAFQHRLYLDCLVLNPGHVYDEMKRELMGNPYD